MRFLEGRKRGVGSEAGDGEDIFVVVDGVVDVCFELVARSGVSSAVAVLGYTSAS